MRTWLITGISSGFGYEMTKQLLAAGDRVIGTVRDARKIEKMKNDYPENLECHVLDITDVEKTRALVAEITGRYDRIDVVVSNAGYGVLGAIEELDDAEIEKIIATNLTGNINFIKSTLAKLREQGGGRIIQMSSYNDQVSVCGWGLYCATKAGISSFCETLAQEVVPFNIGVTIVEPGSARTDYFRHVKIAKMRKEYEHCHASLSGLKNANETKQGDPVKMIECIINSVNIEPAPLRLLLGSVALEQVLRTLKEKIAFYEGQRQVASLTDVMNTRLRYKKSIFFPSYVQGRKVIIWSVGQEFERMMNCFDWTEWDESIECFVDKSSSKVGKICLGRMIKRPEDIHEWSKYFVVVASTLYYKEIAGELEDYGLEEKKDFVAWRDLIDRIILGVSCQDGIYTVCAIVNGMVLEIQKHENYLVAQERCLLQLGYSVADIDAVICCNNPLEKLDIAVQEGGKDKNEQLRICKSIADEIKLVEQIERFSNGKWRGKVYFCGSNAMLAMSAYIASPYKDAVVVVYNSMGYTSIGMMKDGYYQSLKKLGCFDSPELFYEVFVRYLKKVDEVSDINEKICFGDPILYDWLIENCIQLHEDGSIALNRDFFTFYNDHLEITREGMDLLEKLGTKRKNLVASIKKVVEDVLERTVTYAKKISGMENVCVVGARVLELIEESRLKENNLLDSVWFYHQDGGVEYSVEGAIYGYHRLFEQKSISVLEYNEGMNVLEITGETSWLEVEEDILTLMKYSSADKVKILKSSISKIAKETSDILKRQILVDILAAK